MGAFDKINNNPGLTLLTAPEMNKIHFETGEHSLVGKSNSGSQSAEKS